MYPAELKYTKSHEWVRADGAIATVGITFHAQDEIQDVVYVELPEIGEHFAQGGEFGVIESVKAAFDLYAPVSGEIVAINEGLEETPEAVNESPYETGWMIQIRMSNLGELEALMEMSEYQAMLETGESS